ncbi:MAG: hypothetical protein VW711_00965, partial [Verrucomicrobiales bacterium]
MDASSPCPLAAGIASKRNSRTKVIFIQTLETIIQIVGPQSILKTSFSASLALDSDKLVMGILKIQNPSVERRVSM